MPDRSQDRRTSHTAPHLRGVRGPGGDHPSGHREPWDDSSGHDRSGHDGSRQSASGTAVARSPEHGALKAELRHDVPRLLGGGVVVYAFLAVAGVVMTRVFAGGPVVRMDQRVSRWFFEQRTPNLNSLTHVGTMLSDTPTAIALTVVLVVGLRLWLHRWREAVTILVSILGELFIFVLVTATVHRQRPVVPHLDPAPPTSSFPSGHTGAAVALYVGLAVILWQVTQHPGAASRGVVRAVCFALCLVPVVVGLSRLYRGMHFLTDVVAGALAGGLWMVIVVWVVLLHDGAPRPVPSVDR